MTEPGQRVASDVRGSQPPIPSVETQIDSAFQSELDKMEAESDGGDTGINYFERMNEEELSRHFEKFIGEAQKNKEGWGEEKEEDEVEMGGKAVSGGESGAEPSIEPSMEPSLEPVTEPPPFGTTATSTTTYKGLLIPANSELVKKTESSVLKRYRQLLEGHDSVVKKPVDVAAAQLAALPLTITAPDHLSLNIQMLINVLPVLDNLSTQILRIISKGPFDQLMELVSNKQGSYSGIAFGNLVELFETTKRVYNSEENPLFTVENVTFGLWKFGQEPPMFLRGREETIEGTLRKVNLATFLLATFGVIDLGFFFLNESFLDVFCPPQGLDPAKSISYLNQDDTLYSTLPAAAAATAATSVPATTAVSAPTQTNNAQPKGVPHLTKFLKSQAVIYLELKTQAFISAMELGDRPKEEVLRELFPDDMDIILLRRKDFEFDASKTTIERNSTFFSPAELDFMNRCDKRKEHLLEVADVSELMQKYEWMQFLSDLWDYVSRNVGFLIWGPKGKISTQLDKHAQSVTREKQQHQQQHQQQEQVAQQPPPQQQQQQQEQQQQQGEKRKTEETDGESETPAAKSRAASVASESPRQPPKKKQNRSTFRRNWTKDEENALREGLKLKGTHWTAILELFGAGGSISEALKNRTSLQLKDKARNWKLYYFKNNLEIPDYLLNATGGGPSRSQTKSLLAKSKEDKSDSVATGESAAADEFKSLVAQAFN